MFLPARKICGDRLWSGTFLFRFGDTLVEFYVWFHKRFGSTGNHCCPVTGNGGLQTETDVAQGQQGAELQADLCGPQRAKESERGKRDFARIV